jgi:hypothetical protein
MPTRQKQRTFQNLIHSIKGLSQKVNSTELLIDADDHPASPFENGSENLKA